MGNQARSRCGRTERVSWAAQALPARSRGGLGATPTGHWGAGPEWHLRPGQQTESACALAARAGQGPRLTRRDTGGAIEAESGLSPHSASRGDLGPYPLGSRDAQSPPEALAGRSQTKQVPIVAREVLTLAWATAAPGPGVRPQPVAQALEPCDLLTASSVPSPWPSHPEGRGRGRERGPQSG